MSSTKIIRLNDINSCPKGSLAPNHYRGDGTCLCASREQAQAEYDAAVAEVHAAEAKAAQAKRFLDAT